MQSQCATNQNEITKYISYLINQKAHKLVYAHGFNISDRKDIEQELALEVSRCSSKFDPAKSSLKTFLSLIIDRRVQDLLRHRSAKKRNPLKEAISFNETLDDGDGNQTQLVELLSDDTDNPFDPAPNRTIDAITLKLDVDSAVALLPPELQEVCQALTTNNPSEVARIMKISRSALYSRIRAIRTIFTAAGLENYF